MDDVVFEYRLSDAGCAEVTFRAGHGRFEATASYECQPLDRLIEAALAIARGEQRESAYWYTDDGDDYTWRLERTPAGLNIYVGKHRRLITGRQGNAVLIEDCSVHAFCSAIVEGAAQLYLSVGHRGYRESTLTPFPADALDALEAITLGSPSR